MNVYKIENIITGDCYIGSETNDNSRWRQHISRLRRNCHHSIYLQRAFNKYGEINFVFSLIEVGINDNIILLQREQHYIDTENSKYNMCRIAGNTSGILKTKEQKDKLASISRTLYYSNNKSDVFTMKNKQHSDKSKAKIGASNKNKIITNEMKSKISKGKSIYRIFVYNIETLEVLNIFSNVGEAANFYNSPTRKIKDYLNTKFGIFKGSIIRYEHDKPISLTKNNRLTPIIWSDKDGNYLGEFKSLVEAELKTKIPSVSISQSINKNCLAKGYRFNKNIIAS
jgi:group I intron endonuclease